MNEMKHIQWLHIMERALKEGWGMLPSPPDERDWPLSAIAEPVTLPPAVRLDNFVPFILDQGKCGTCVAFSGAQINNVFANRRQALPKDGLSPLFLYVRCKEEDGIPKQEGTYPRVALKVMQKDGIAPESTLPYSRLPQDACLLFPEITATHIAAAQDYRVKAYARLQAVEEMKQALVAGKLIMAGVLVTDSFLCPVDGVIPLPEGRILGAHAIALCGYDDAKKAFRMVNSWGVDWGEKGFAWLPYAFCTWKADLGMEALMESWAVETEYIPLRERTEILDQPPVIINNRTMAPVRWIIENSGGIVLSWDNDTKTVTYRTAKGEVVVMQVDNPKVKVRDGTV